MVLDQDSKIKVRDFNSKYKAEKQPTFEDVKKLSWRESS